MPPKYALVIQGERRHAGRPWKFPLGPGGPVRTIVVSWMSEGRLTVMDARTLSDVAALLDTAVAPTS